MYPARLIIVQFASISYLHWLEANLKRRLEVGADQPSSVKFVYHTCSIFFNHVKSSENWKLIYYHVVICAVKKEVTGLSFNFCQSLQAVLR